MDHASYFQALRWAAHARLTLAGKIPGGGFWQVPEGRDFILLCWRNNMARARRIRMESRR